LPCGLRRGTFSRRRWRGYLWLSIFVFICPLARWMGLLALNFLGGGLREVSDAEGAAISDLRFDFREANSAKTQDSICLSEKIEYIVLCLPHKLF
jgi:hypothetical protein